MAKFKLQVKISGFEVNVEGERADLPAIAHNVGQQFARMLEPTTKIVEAQIGNRPSEELPAGPSLAEVAGPARKKRAVRRAPSEGADSSDVLEWRHDPEKWGIPQQTWNTANKAIWLLEVSAAAVQRGEISSGVIAATFNKHFKQAGVIQVGKINRDLGKQKLAKPPTVGEDTTGDSPRWFLTDQGKLVAQTLIKESRAAAAAPAAS